MWLDEIARAAFGLLVSWPVLWACRRGGLSAGATALLLTAYMVPSWLVYAWLAAGVLH